MQNKFLIYEGEFFTLEWYCDDRGKSDVFNYYEELSKQQKKKLYYLFYMMADTGRIRSEQQFNYEGDQLYAFKPTPDRFLCFFYQGSKIIITNAFIKKTDKLPPREKQKALKLKNDFIKRYKKGLYYE